MIKNKFNLCDQERNFVSTGKSEQIVPVERRFVELVNLDQILSVDVLPQSSFPAGFVSNQRFQHCPHHVELSRGRT